MNLHNFTAAKIAAKRFQEACEAMETRIVKECDGKWFPVTGTRESGAVRRTSMDLTRALAELRKP